MQCAQHKNPRNPPVLNADTQEREVPLILNLNNPLIEQQPTPLQPKAAAIASAAIPLTRDDIPWPNTVLVSTNLFVARSWLIPHNGNEIPITAFIKMEESLNAESVPPKQTVTHHPKVLSNSSQNNKSLEELCGWGPQCPICEKSASNLKTEDSEEDDWNEIGKKQRRK